LITGVTAQQLTPEQDRAIGRIQLVGVLLLAGIAIATRLIDAGHSIAGWKLLLIALGAMVAVVLVGGLAVSRVEQRPYREVMLQSLRSTGDGVKTAPMRVRRRIADAFSRRRAR
jgi:hypothetical protein